LALKENGDGTPIAFAPYGIRSNKLISLQKLEAPNPMLESCKDLLGKKMIEHRHADAGFCALWYLTE
jgi:hypothetical protein